MKTKIAFVLSFSIALSALVAFGVPGTISSSTNKNAIVIGTKRVYLSHQAPYLFESNTDLIFEAPNITGWTFDHTEVTLWKCPNAIGVDGSNIRNTFTIDNGYITECSYC